MQIDLDEMQTHLDFLKVLDVHNQEILILWTFFIEFAI